MNGDLATTKRVYPNLTLAPETANQIYGPYGAALMLSVECEVVLCCPCSNLRV